MPIITTQNGESFKAPQDTPIIQAAANAGLQIPYSCKTGRCSTCRCKVLSGETMAFGPETGLSEAEIVEGWIQACVRYATSDLVLEVEDIPGFAMPPVKTLPCRINTLDRLRSDVIRVSLRLPPSAEFEFLPGQYISVIGPGGINRSYSLANAQSEDKLLELHIRAVSGGAMSDYWFKKAKINDLLRFTGPQGTFSLRDVAGLNLVFLTTGTGIAPVKAILEGLSFLSEEKRPQTVTVICGARVKEDLYFNVLSIPGNHTFIPVLSRAGNDWQGARGYVQDALLRMDGDLTNTAVYACGSIAMIQSAKEVLVSSGLSDNRFHSDAFVCSANNSFT